MKIKRSVAILLIISVMIFSLSSCVLDAAGAMEKANRAMRENPFSVKVSFDVETESDELDAVLGTLNVADIVLYIDGDNAKFTMGVEVLGNFIGCDYVMYQGVLYSQMELGGLSTVKQKATLEREDIEEFFENSVDLSFIDEFNSYELAKDGDAYKIICTDAVNDYKDDLLEEIDEQMAALDFDITVNNAALEMIIKDDKYQTMYMTSSYTFSHGEESYTVTFNYTYEFEYGEKFAIAAPTDPDSYTEVDFDKLFDIG